jgi:GntR family transcriptional regulator
MVQLKLDAASPIPMYLQIVEQVRRAVASGGLQADDEMPSVRALASEHLINPNTVARAYLELEREGLLTKRRGAGTYVAHEAAGLRDAQRTRIVAGLIDKALQAAHEFGWTPAQTRKAFEERLDHMNTERKR